MTDMVLSKMAGASSVGSMFGAGYFALTDAVSISIVTSVSAVLMAGISAYFGYKAKSAAEQARVIAENTGKAVDGHLTEFKAMARQQFTAEGKLAGKAEEKATQAIVEAAVSKVINPMDRTTQIIHTPPPDAKPL